MKSSLPHIDRKLVIFAAMFAAPIVTVQLAMPFHRVMGAPQQASASPMIVQPETPLTLPKPSDAQRAAAKRAEALHGQPGPIATPFYYAPRRVDVQRVDPVIDEPVRDAPRFAISSIVEARDGRVLAMVNGKMCGVGASPSSGWRIISIDATAKTVTMRSDEGEELVLRFGRSAPGAN